MTNLCLWAVVSWLGLANSEYHWIGGVASDVATISTAGFNGASFTLNECQQSQCTEARKSKITQGHEKIPLQNLKQSTSYKYKITKSDGSTVSGSFKTFPEPGTPFSFKFGFGSCMFVGTKYNSDISLPVWDDIGSKGVDMFIHGGDLNYEDIDKNNPNKYLQAFETALSNPHMQAFIAKTPMTYTWDDHDYGKNGADGDSPSKVAARYMYRQSVPHYPLPDWEDDSGYCKKNKTYGYHKCYDNSGTWVGEGSAIYHAFTVGRVRFVITDQRSEQYEGKQMWSEKQKQWFFNELKTYKDTAQVVFWLTSTPWNGEPEPEKDNWQGYPKQREEIANWISNNNITNLIALSGDAHMLAFDDGTNTDFNTVGGKAGFPLMHSSPIYNWGSSKGGIFSHGCVGYTLVPISQFAVITVTDTQEETCVTFEGFVYNEPEHVLQGKVCAPFVIKGATPGKGRCSLSMWPDWVWVIFFFFVSFFMLEHVLLFMLSSLKPTEPGNFFKTTFTRGRLLGLLNLYGPFLIWVVILMSDWSGRKFWIVPHVLYTCAISYFLGLVVLATYHVKNKKPAKIPTDLSPEAGQELLNK